MKRDLKLTKFRAIALRSKKAVDKTMLLLFCSWRGSITAAGAMKETKFGLSQTYHSAKLGISPKSSYDVILPHIVLKIFLGYFHASAPQLLLSEGEIHSGEG